MWPQRPATTAKLTLAEVVARLAEHADVAGVVQLGSTGDGTLTTASDYDLLVILNAMTVPLYVLFTTIDGRLTDVIFSDTHFIDDILHNKKIAPATPTVGNLLTWLQEGQIVYDADGRLHAAQAKIAHGSWLCPPDDKAVFEVWQGIHYNYHQTKRMLLADDEVYQTAVDLRLTYMLTDMWFGYFTVRRLPWQGEKKAVHYWQSHDPAYLAIFEKYLQARQRHRRFALYTELAQHTLEPVGGLLLTPTTTATLTGDDWQTADVAIALDFWDSLLSFRN
jgi:hypothetical protein